MPNILALDCSTANCSVALKLTKQADCRQLAKLRQRSHHRLILPMVERLLMEAKISLTQLDEIICGLGPGSFVGTRIAIGVAKGLSYPHSLKLRGVSSLRALAQQVLEQHPANGRNFGILSVLTAKAGEIYWAYYETELGGESPARLDEVSPPSLAYTTELKQLPGRAGLPVVISGDAQLPIEYLASKFHIQHYLTQAVPSARDLIAAAAAEPLSNYLTAAQLKPIYLYNDLS